MTSVFRVELLVKMASPVKFLRLQTLLGARRVVPAQHLRGPRVGVAVQRLQDHGSLQ